MGLKDGMMKRMIGNMSKEEKLEMMDKMMEEFFSGLSQKEKMEIMMNMMPRMMSEMMEGVDVGEMMEGMFKSGDEGAVGMKEMMECCSQMMEGCDEDFCNQMRAKMMEFMKEGVGGGEEDASTE